MFSQLIVESGSTKTDWCLIKDGEEPKYYKTSGINPYLQSADDIIQLLSSELELNVIEQNIQMLSYYGAGAGLKVKQDELKEIFHSFFDIEHIHVKGDMLAAARGLCGEEKGIVCILGTGSNSCYYDGDVIKEQKASLGYIAGDEGSGNHLGKRVLRYYAYNTFDEDLTDTFESLFGNDIPKILDRLYKQPFPNRYLANFVEVLLKHRGHYMVENIIEDSFNEFFHHHVLKYRESWNSPLYFTGSVAYEFKDVLQSICDQYELTIGSIVKSPLEGLVAYHKQLTTTN